MKKSLFESLREADDTGVYGGDLRSADQLQGDNTVHHARKTGPEEEYPFLDHVEQIMAGLNGRDGMIVTKDRGARHRRLGWIITKKSWPGMANVYVNWYNPNLFNQNAFVGQEKVQAWGVYPKGKGIPTMTKKHWLSDDNFEADVLNVVADLEGVLKNG